MIIFTFNHFNETWFFSGTMKLSFLFVPPTWQHGCDIIIIASLLNNYKKQKDYYKVAK